MKLGLAAASALFSVCLLALVGNGQAWFLATEETETAANSTAETAPAAATQPPATAAAPAVGKVREASSQHRQLVEDDLIRMAHSSRAPEPDHVTKTYWNPGQLPAWLPEQVRQQFQVDNQENIRQRAGMPQPTTTATPAVVEHVTRDYWENFPSWINEKVKSELQRDNRDFLRRLARVGAELDTTTQPPADHVTRIHWEALPTWLSDTVRRQFELDNQLVERRLSGRANSARTTEQPEYEHVTRNYWEKLPAWLPKQVRDEIYADNRNYIMRLAGIEETGTSTASTTTTTTKPTKTAAKTTATTTTADREPITPGRRPNVIRVAARRMERADPRQPRAQPPLPPTPPTPGPAPATPPTRQLLTVESIDQLPRKCRQQLNWREQPKCSSSRSKWTFDLAEMKCKWFAHYGCQLNNGNIFNSLLDCQNYCVRRILNPCEAVRCEKKYTLYQSHCFLLKDEECSNRVLSNFSNIPDAELKLQLAKEDIELKCQPPAARCLNTAPQAEHPAFESPPTYIHATRLPAHCEQPQDRGFCTGNQRVRLARAYFYSKRQNQCKFMVNFGCSRNQNYFTSLADCYNSCGL